MLLFAIDPGPQDSGYVCFDGAALIDMGILPNNVLLHDHIDRNWASNGAALAIEQIRSYGMPVGVDVFDCVWWTGRFWQAWVANGGFAHHVTRQQVKLHLCGNARAKDANVRQALIDRFGPGKALAVGLKKTPGPLYGVRRDIWSALAVAVTWWDCNGPPAPKGAGAGALP